RVFFTICSSIVLCTGALASPGDLDPAFGAGGRVLTQFGTSQDEGRAIAVQPDGKIVVAGFMDPGFGLYDFAIARYNPDGTLDTSFGGGGKVTVNFGFQTNGNPTVDIANAIAIQSDGSIFVAGQSIKNGNGDFAIVKLQSNGIIPANFGSGGVVTFNAGTN